MIEGWPLSLINESIGYFKWKAAEQQKAQRAAQARARARRGR